MDPIAKEALPHLRYEFQMLLATARLLQTRGLPSDHAYALLESWVLHVRNLIDFFYTPKKMDDVVMVEFSSGWKGIREFPKITTELARARDRANKEMAHLTYSRIGKSDADRQWAVGPITSQLIERMKAFADLVADDETSTEVRKLLPKDRKARFVVAAVANTSGFSGEATVSGPFAKRDPGKDQ